jgi:hypothetical protein
MPNLGIWELLIVLVVFGGFALWIVALVDAIRVPDDSMYRSGNKTVWVLVIALTGFIGAIIYYAAGRPGRDVAPPRSRT